MFLLFYTLKRVHDILFKRTLLLFIQGRLFHVWLKLAWSLWIRQFLNVVTAFLSFCYHLSLGFLHLKKLESLYLRCALWQVWVKLTVYFYSFVIISFRKRG